MPEATIDQSGSVKQVLATTLLAEHLVGARLRFPVPDLPQQPVTEIVDDQANRTWADVSAQVSSVAGLG